MVTNVQDWLNNNLYKQEKYNTKEKRSKIIELNIINRWSQLKIMGIELPISLPWSEPLEGSLDLSEFANPDSKLKKLDCRDNKITSLNVNGLTKLETLFCQNNRITALDLRQNTGLKTLFCQNNQIEIIDFGNTTTLERLSCSENPLTRIIGLQNLRKLTFINSTPFSPINQLGIRIDNARVLLTGSDEYNYNALLSREVEACQAVINASLENMPQENKNQAQQEQVAYEAQIEQVATWLQQK